MPVKFTYLAINLGTVLVPFLFSFHPRLQFRQAWKSFFSANAVVAAIFIVWDVIFTSAGVWGFNPRYLCGLYLMNLPLEEVLFFTCIPYASVFTYYSFKKYIRADFFPDRVFTIIVVGASLLLAAIYYHRLYTMVTCFALAVGLAWLGFWLRPSWLKVFYLSFIVIMVPFFIVNGLLTGSWLQEPVVWYNEAEITGVRMLTIPLEDLFYCMLMLFMNTWLFEKFNKTQPV